MKNVISLLFLFVLTFFQPVVFGQDVWTQKANFPGINRWGASTFTINGKVYVGMGSDGSADYGDLWEYDPMTDSWNQKATYPVKRRTASAFTINGKGYVCGGINSGGLLNDVVEYDPSTNTWTPKASFPGGARYGAAGFSIGNKGYICCGNLGSASGPYTKELLEYDPQTNSWNQKADFTGNPRYGLTHTEFVIGTKAYTGMGVSGPNGFNDMYCYDQPTNSWNQIANYPGDGRAYLAGFAVCNSGYLGTGQLNGIPYSDFWKYEPSTNTWTKLADFVGGDRRLMVATEVNGKVFVGTGDNSTSRFSDWWEYSCSGVGIGEVEFSSSMVVSPNPFTMQMTLQFERPLKNGLLKIYDSNGRMVKQIADIGGSSLTVERGALPEGLYFVYVLQAGELISNSKVMIID